MADYVAKGAGSDVAAENHNMSEADKADLAAAGERYNNATTEGEREQAHKDAEAIRDKYNYSGGDDGSEDLPKNTTTTSTVSRSDYDTSAPTASDYGVTSQQEALNTQKQYLDQLKAAQEQQAILEADNTMQQGIIDYQRTLADSNADYATEQAAIAADEKNAQDNSALYAELRGDKGGIGQAQYNQIAATAMANRQAVQTAQNTLATDTQRAITDLRTQGQFEKADALLEISQNYMSQLMSIYQWATEYGLSVAEFNESMREWQEQFNESLYEFDANLQYQYDNLNENIREYDTTLAENQRQFDISAEMDEASLTGMYKGSPTYSALEENASLLFTANGDTSGYEKLWESLGYSDETVASMKKALDSYWTAQNSGGTSSDPTETLNEKQTEQYWSYYSDLEDAMADELQNPEQYMSIKNPDAFQIHNYIVSEIKTWASNRIKAGADSTVMAAVEASALEKENARYGDGE